MPFFTGEHESKIGAKRRLAISSALREDVDPEDGDKFYLILGPDKHLWLYPDEYYRKLAANLKRSLLPSQQARKLSLFFAMARKVNPDSQGRMIIPEKSIQRAGLQDVESVMLIGQSDHIEIWPEDEWERHLEDDMPVYGDTLYEVQPALDADCGTDASSFKTE